MSLPIDLYIEEIKKLKNVVVPMSGGVDSECVAYACVRGNIAFEPAIVEYYYDGMLINEYDIKYAFDFCKCHKLVPTVYKLNFNNFFEQSEYLKYAIEYKVVSPQLCCHMWLMSQYTNMNKALVFNGDVMPPIKHGVDGKYDIPHMPYMYYSYHRFLLNNNMTGIGGLATHSDDIISAFIKVMTKNYKDLYKLEPYNRKCTIYKLAGFNVDPKPKKFTGFETMKKMCTEKSGRTDGRCHFDETYRMPLYNMIKEPSMFNYMNLTSFGLIRSIAEYVATVESITNDSV